LQVTVAHTACSHCLDTNTWFEPITQPWLNERRRLWKTVQKEAQVASKALAQADWEARKVREEAEKALMPMERQWAWMTDLAAFRSREENNGVPLKDRLFVIPFPHWIHRLDRYTPTSWDDSGLLRNVDHGEMINNPSCSLCQKAVGMRTGRKLPCGHVFHHHCVSKFLDYRALSPSCPDCKESWEVHTFPDFELKHEGHATSRFRRFKSWIRWVKDPAAQAEGREFSDLENSDDEEEDTAASDELIRCPGW